jgi:hypothetical protein
MTWQQFLTEKVLKECYHEGSSLLNAGYHCRKCDKIFSCNRTFDNRNDLLDLYEAINRDGKWGKYIIYSYETFEKSNLCSVSEGEYIAYLLCLDGKEYEDRCKMVAEFYGWGGE